MPIKFDDYREAIIAKLSPLTTISHPGKKFHLLTDFCMLPIVNKIDGYVEIGHGSLPSVAIIDEVYGEVHLFAFKILFPEVEFYPEDKKPEPVAVISSSKKSFLKRLFSKKETTNEK